MSHPLRWGNEILEGWGRYRRVRSIVVSPTKTEAISSVLSDSNDPLIGFGKGRSYGDSSLNSNGRTIKFDHLNHLISFDPKTGVAICEPGISLDEILDQTVSHGWFLPVTPGTRFPTLAGCLAADVHGKNHHVAGSIGKHIEWFTLLLADGTVVKCSPNENTELFQATLGGMGLTGIIQQIALRLMKVDSTYIHAETIRTTSLRETMDELAANDSQWPYTVAWGRLYGLRFPFRTG